MVSYLFYFFKEISHFLTTWEKFGYNSNKMNNSSSKLYRKYYLSIRRHL